jgi:hypothetical protein
VEFLHSAALVLNRSVHSNYPIDILNIKLKHFKKYFKGWGSNLYGHNKKLKRELKEELVSIEALEEMNDLSPELNLRKTNIHVKLFNLFAEEELLWYQRSHEKWLLEGDLNTSYFHRVANGRKRKNTMFSLKENDILIEGLIISFLMQLLTIRIFLALLLVISWILIQTCGNLMRNS